MKRYPAWQALYRSFYSLDFYRDVAQNWKEIGFLYLYLLAGLNWAALAISFQVALTYACDKVFLPMADQMPTVTSANGKFSVDKPAPYHIRELNSGRPVITFDTTGKTSTLASTGLLVTEKEVILFSGGSPENKAQTIFTADSAGAGSLSASNIRNVITLIRSCGTAIFFVIGWTLGTVFLFVQALLYSIVGLIFNAISSAKLSFDKLLRLSAIAITPPVLIDTVVRCAMPTLLQAKDADMSFKIVSFIISMIYLYLGVAACKGLTSPASAQAPITPAPAVPARIPSTSSDSPVAQLNPNNPADPSNAANTAQPPNPDGTPPESPQ